MRFASRHWSGGAAIALVLLLPTACADDDRPATDAWSSAWRQEAAAFPDSVGLLDGGRALCDDLVGRMRASRSELTPTPDEALDGAVTDWFEVAESIAFDCPDDAAELDRRYAELAVHQAEIDAGLDVAG